MTPEQKNKAKAVLARLAKDFPAIPSPLVVLVCGGRDFDDRARVDLVLDALSSAGPLVIVHGDCPTGADSMASDWAMRTDCPMQPFPADWKRHGRKAGPLRNAEMLRVAKPHLVVAFPGGAGTAHTSGLALKAGVKLWALMPTALLEKARALSAPGTSSAELDRKARVLSALDKYAAKNRT